MIFAAITIVLSALGAAPDPALTSEPYLAEVTRHLYRWRLDEDDVRSEVHRGEFVYWIREIERELDEGDESRFAEILLPRVGIGLQVKKADYEIPELGIRARNDLYMIASVAEFEPIDTPVPEGVTEIRLDYAKMREHLFQTRLDLKPPEGEVLLRMRRAAREQAAKRFAAESKPLPTTAQTVYLSPVSPVANEVWAFWEEGRVLFRFHADVDLEDPELWEHQGLTVELFELDSQVVVSLDEVAGSNAYVTRDMVGRVLFNCIVFGRREVLEPLGAGAPAAE